MQMRKAFPASLFLAVALVLSGTIADAAGKTVRVGYGSTYDLGDVASLIALERLEEMGYRTEPIQFAESELAVDAVMKGYVDFSPATITAPLAALQYGADIKFFVTQGKVEQAIMAADTITQCSDLQGARVGIHSWQSATLALTDAYVDQNCPGTEPQYQVVPNSSVRAQSMLQNQIVASSLELVEVVLLQDSGGFHMLANFGDLGVLNNVFFATPRYLQENGDVIVDFIQALVDVHRDIAADPSLLVSKAPTYLPGIDEDRLPRIVEAYLEADVWPTDPVLTYDSLGATIEFYRNSGVIEEPLDVRDVTDLSHLRAAGF